MKAENNETRKEILMLMEEGFDAQGVAAAVIGKGADEAPVDILSVIHTEIEGLGGPARGRYYFPEYEGPDNVQFFTCAIELSDPLDEKKEAVINRVCAEVNPGLVCGAFMVYPEVGLVYNLSFPLIEDLSEAELFDQVNISVGNALAQAAAYVGEFRDAVK